VHRFSDDPARPLILGGVVITGEDARGLEGHSDADALSHAVADAVLGAAGLGDIGRWAPDTDPQWRGADSMALLGQMSEVLGGPVNVKATTAEGLGALGRAEGIACHAVVLMASEGDQGADPTRAG
jgi:2C-methyl-D-erythritol 2,4-cyclodiphosphate synthase